MKNRRDNKYRCLAVLAVVALLGSSTSLTLADEYDPSQAELPTENKEVLQEEPQEEQQDDTAGYTGGELDFSAGDYSFAEDTSQIIDVQTTGSTGQLTLYNKEGDSFVEQLTTSCYVGRNGISYDRVESDGTTPAGVYTLGQAFGIASDPGSTRGYLNVQPDHYWVDDSTSEYYNQLVDSRETGIKWNSAEHLIDYTVQYQYAIAIDYNTDCIPDKGSAIFLHCTTGSPTDGCVAVSESDMITILQSLTSDTRIYIH